MTLAVVIMRIEHIEMYVNDFEATKESFIKYKRETRNKFIWVLNLIGNNAFRRGAFEPPFEPPEWYNR